MADSTRRKYKKTLSKNLSDTKRSEDKEAALEKFKITFQKQRLWNEVLKIEKSADAQLGRSFEFALPKEWSRQEQIQYTADYIKKHLWIKGMWLIGVSTTKGMAILMSICF